MATAADADTRREMRRFREWRGRERGRIIRLLWRLGYPVMTWAEAERIARRLTARH